MIQPNFTLMLWIMFILYCLKSISLIMLGAMGQEKSNKYDGGDIIAGLISLLLMAIVAFN